MHGLNHAEKCILEEVVGQTRIPHHAQQVAVNTLLVPAHQHAKRTLISLLDVGRDQLLVAWMHPLKGKQDERPPGDL